MIELLQLLCVGHVHKYKIIRERGLNNGWGGRGTRYIIQCEVCGKIKKVDCI